MFMDRVEVTARITERATSGFPLGEGLWWEQQQAQALALAPPCPSSVVFAVQLPPPR